MQLAQIEAFVEIAQQHSISRAAENLYLTQPALTSRLQSLEAELGERLFVRVKYGVTLTDAGKTFLPYAQRVMRTLTEARGALANLREATVGNLYLGAGPFIGTYILPTLLQLFAFTHPRVHVGVRTGHSEEVLSMVLNEEVQIGMVRKLKHPEVETVKLWDDELVLVVPPGHDFCRHESVTVEEMAAEGLVLFDRATSYYELVNDLFLSHGLEPKATFELDNVEAAKKIVEKGLGISLLPRITIARELSLGTVKAVPIAGSPHETREMVAIYRRAGGLGGIAHAFLNTIDQLPQYLPESEGIPPMGEMATCEPEQA
jgi:DNA-binding transcriptional LysR family regulator